MPRQLEGAHQSRRGQVQGEKVVMVEEKETEKEEEEMSLTTYVQELQVGYFYLQQGGQVLINHTTTVRG